MPRRLRLAIAFTVLAVFCVRTASIWKDFEREELAGLRPALARVADDSASIGLDFVRISPRIKYPVYLQIHSYAQLLHGGTLNFSFINLASSLVVKRDLSTRDPWTQRLEWRPDHLQPSDLDHFEYALIHAPPGIEMALMTREPRLIPETGPDRWRLFRIIAAPGSSLASEAQ